MEGEKREIEIELERERKHVSCSSLSIRIADYYSSTSNKSINWVLFSGSALGLARKNLDKAEQGSLQLCIPSHCAGRKLSLAMHITVNWSMQFWLILMQ